MRLPSGERSSEWVARLPAVVAALNGEVTRLTGKRPVDKNQATLVHLNSREVIIEDIGSGKGWAGYQAAQLVFLVCTDELHVDPLATVLHSLPEH